MAHHDKVLAKRDSRLHGQGYGALALAVVLFAVEEANLGCARADSWLTTDPLCEFICEQFDLDPAVLVAKWRDRQVPGRLKLCPSAAGRARLVAEMRSEGAGVTRIARTLGATNRTVRRLLPRTSTAT